MPGDTYWLYGDNPIMNLFELPDISTDKEFSENLVPDKGVCIERIISFGQASPEGFWYDQDRDEWVALIQGEAVLRWKNGEVKNMKPGDWVFIPAHEKHRVDKTTSDPPCLWLAVHGKIS